MVYSSGRSFVEACLVLHVLPLKEEPEALQIGFSVSKKVGNAVTRNRIKRRLRALCQKYLKDLPKGHLLVFVARKRAVEMDHEKLDRCLRKALTSAKLLNKEDAGLVLPPPSL